MYDAKCCKPDFYEKLFSFMSGVTTNHWHITFSAVIVSVGRNRCPDV